MSLWKKMEANRQKIEKIPILCDFFEKNLPLGID